VIENFTAQPYPLECTADGVTWTLVIGWQKAGLKLVPVVADGLVADGTATKFRPARPGMTGEARP
jgi:hypothetical protein